MYGTVAAFAVSVAVGAGCTIRTTAVWVYAPLSQRSVNVVSETIPPAGRFAPVSPSSHERSVGSEAVLVYTEHEETPLALQLTYVVPGDVTVEGDVMMEREAAPAELKNEITTRRAVKVTAAPIRERVLPMCK